LPDIPNQPKVPNIQHFTIGDIPTSNTADTSNYISPNVDYSPLTTFKPIPLLDMQALTASMSNLELAKIEQTSPVTLRSERFRPTLKSINEHYVEMAPLSFKSKSEEKLASTEVIVVTDNATENPVYSSPKSIFKSRFRLNPSEQLQNQLSKLDLEQSTDKPVKDPSPV
jgi:hypothetical protein